MERFNTLPEGFRETTKLDKLVEVELTEQGLRTTEDELVNLSFVGVEQIMVSYLMREQFVFKFTGTMERYKQDEACLRTIPENATHYFVGNTETRPQNYIDFIPVSFFKDGKE